MINAKHESSRFVIYAGMFLLIAFILLMLQNIIRYGAYDGYDPWRSIIYLGTSLLLFIPLVPISLQIGSRIPSGNSISYWSVAVLLSLTLLGLFFALSNILLHLIGYYEAALDPVYARRYFGREALFHLLVLLAGFFYVKNAGSNKLKTVSGTVGRKEVKISMDMVKWIEADDHYLRIHTEENLLMKRTTLEQMASALQPDFIRIHRKYLVNRHHIVGKERQQREEYVILKSGERLKIGRSYLPFEI